MAIIVLNGVHVFSESQGDRGAPVVLVHGSWGDHHNWDAVVPGLARTFRVFSYDRRGHSQSERAAVQGSIEEDAADLAALIATSHLAPAHVVGSSFGAIVTLKLAAARPELFASLSIHEPPLIGLLGNDPMLNAVRQRIERVMLTLRSGATELGAKEFVETVAFGPGTWERLTPQMRQTFVFNAPTWLDEMNEPGAFTLDLGRLASFTQPVLMTQGDQSPPFFGMILDSVGMVLGEAQHHTFRGAGHVPHVTHPADFVDVVTAFINAAAL